GRQTGAELHAHAEGLGTLPGEEECGLGHRSLLGCPATRSDKRPRLSLLLSDRRGRLSLRRTARRVYSSPAGTLGLASNSFTITSLRRARTERAGPPGAVLVGPAPGTAGAKMEGAARARSGAPPRSRYPEAFRHPR